MNPSVDFIILDTVDSTNSYAKELLQREDFAPTRLTAVLAFNQVAGRGRLGREWLSKKGEGIAMSLIFPNICRPDITLLTALGVHSAIKELLPPKAQEKLYIKWPNDIVYVDKKLCGILTEGTPRGCVVGIGINLNTTKLPPEIRDKATSLRLICQRDFDIEAVARLVAQSVAEWIIDHKGKFTHKAKAAYTPLCLNIGKEVSFGTPPRTGRATGISPQGSLVVKTEGGYEGVRFGEVFVSGIY